jgi:ubiquitin C-terminal hydrolase
LSNSNDYSRKMTEFMDDVFNYTERDQEILNPTGLKNLIRKKFYPMMQHDSHEFLMHLMSELQDEETPVANKKFNGDVSGDN